MTVLAPPPAPSPGQAPAAPEQRFLLDAVTWRQYVAIGGALLNRPGLRMNYDRGRLEFMTLSPAHEIYRKWLGRLLETLAEECGVAIVTAGQMTLQRYDLERGMEPDDCFWVAHEPQMRGRLDWDPHRDPPPDLVIAVEVSRSIVDRLAILAALGVAEVWRFDGQTLRVLTLQADGTYAPAERSHCFPGVPVTEIAPFARPSATVDYLSRVREFRTWVREQLARPQTTNG